MLPISIRIVKIAPRRGTARFLEQDAGLSLGFSLIRQGKALVAKGFAGTKA